MEANTSVPDSSADMLAEFVEAATHHVLHARRVYPQEAFERTRLFNVLVNKSKHPGLRDYISRTTSEMKPLIASGAARRAAVVIFAPNGWVLERWVIELEANGETTQSEGVARRLAGFFTKLAVLAPSQGALPEGSTFELVVYSSEPAQPDGFWAEEGPMDECPRIELERPIVRGVKDSSGPGFRVSMSLELPQQMGG